jgi:tRNA modification GTPase
MNKLPLEDTIAAVATPTGVGAISVIRVSGPKTFGAVDKIFVGKIKLSEAATHTIHYGKIVDQEGNLIDDVLASVFKNPNSYTGEDSVEISTHGNPLITKKIIELLVEKNIRLAEPGEFTKRAFLNNRIDLAQAEAVADVISSRTNASLKGARNQLDGILSNKVQSLRESLLNATSFVELELDFAEEDVEFINFKDLLKRIEIIIFEINLLLKSYSFGKVIKDGVNVALVGKPNVGKSSLLNYILKESRAIVSKIPGTTRDVIREDAEIDGILFRLYDTAGLRVSEDEIEKEGVTRSREVVKNSDLVLFINDVEQNGSEDILEGIYSLNEKSKVIRVLNKIDLGNKKNINADIYISALNGDGIDKLFLKLKEMVFENSNYSEKSAIVSNLRHFNCLMNSKTFLENAKESINNKLSGEFISVDLRNAANSLGEIIGEVTSEDILNNIFMKFCIGK